MLNILLGILKVIGILLLLMLSLILLVILLVLLGPICYGASGRWKEKKDFSAVVSWIFVLLRAKVEYAEETGLLWTVRLLGIPIASNDEAFVQKKEERRRQKEEKQRLKEEKRRLKEEKQHQTAESQQSKEAELTLKEEGVIVEDSSGLFTEEAVTDFVEIPETEEAENSTDVYQESEANDSPGMKPANESESKKDSQASKTEKKKLSATIKEKITFIKNKINSLIQKIKTIPDKIRKLIQGIKDKIENMKAKIRRILEIKEFFFGERNREGFLHVLTNLKKMAIHILPRKLKGTVEFGVEDPYVMGQILTVLSIFYPAYQDRFTILPDFENPGFAGEASFKGRIIPGYLVLRILIALCNREVIRIMKEGRQLIGGNKA